MILTLSSNPSNFGLFISQKRLKFLILTAITTIIISFTVIVGWIFGIRQVLNILPDAATMKFNTALAFLLSGIGLFASLKNESIYKILNKVIVVGVTSIGLLTFIQYFADFDFQIDNFFVKDYYSNKYPGRMSPATAFCFKLLGIAFIGVHSKSNIAIKISESFLSIISIISLVAIFAYILHIPTESKNFFFDSMAIHTAVLFFLLSQALSFKNSEVGFSSLFLGDLAGSKLIRVLIPFVILLPLFLSYVLLLIIDDGILQRDFAITIYTIIYALFGILYISIIAIRLNKTDLKRKALEHSLRKSNQELLHFKQALDASSLVAVTDSNGVITSVNDKFCEISKYNRDELIGKTHKIINSGYHSKEFFKNLWQKISSGEVWIGGIKNKAKDGSFYWVHTAIIPFKNELGEIYQYLAIRQDITKFQMLSTQYENLKLKNKEIEQFTYIASHDLQEPLRTVTSMAEILKEDYQDNLDNEANICLDYITKASNRMSDLIKGLLDYSRIGGDKELELIDTNKIINCVSEDLASAIKETNTTIKAIDLPELNVYKTEFRLLFQNLISNAIKFRKKEIYPEIIINAEKNDEYWKFSVTDNGIGIKDKHNRNIFGIFQRLHNRDEYKGTGIGLAHCEKIVHLHGGEIWVESEFEKGSTFYFTIPVNLN